MNMLQAGSLLQNFLCLIKMEILSRSKTSKEKKFSFTSTQKQ